MTDSVGVGGILRGLTADVEAAIAFRERGWVERVTGRTGDYGTIIDAKDGTVGGAHDGIALHLGDLGTLVWARRGVGDEAAFFGLGNNEVADDDCGADWNIGFGYFGGGGFIAACGKQGGGDGGAGAK